MTFRRPVVTAAVLLVAAGIGVLLGQSERTGLAAAGIALAVLFPIPLTLLAVVWLAICRPGFELIQTQVGGLAVTEMDYLILLTAVATLRMVIVDGRLARAPKYVLAWLAVWPAIFMFRAVLPAAGDFIQGRGFADLRYVEVWIVVPALMCVAARSPLGSVDWSLRAASALGYVVCTVGIGAWGLSRAGLAPSGNHALALISNPGAVRPGGEIVVVVVAVMLWFNVAWRPFGNRILPTALVVGEQLVSQTLSMLLAIGGAIVLVSLFRASATRLSTKIAASAALLALAALATGAIAANSRFDLSQRAGEDSAQYRLLESQIVVPPLLANRFTAAFGTGPGSEFYVASSTIKDVRVDTVKRDTHDVYVDVAFKTGILGLAGFLVPFVFGARLLRRLDDVRATALIAVLAAVGILSFTVPFYWTQAGFAGFALVWCAIGAIGPRGSQLHEAVS